MAEEAEFIKHLREEKLKAQETRSSYTQKKLAYVTALLGIGVLGIEQFDLNPVLYLVPFVAAAFDLYILAEDYSVKRIGAYLQVRSSAPVEEDWEDWVGRNRDPFALVAMPILSTLMLAGAAVIIWITSGGSVPTLYWPWLVVGLLPSWFLFFLYRHLRDQVPEKAKQWLGADLGRARAWGPLQRRVARADHIVSGEVYREIKEQFLACRDDLPALRQVAPEYGQAEYLLCVDAEGNTVAFAPDTVRDFEAAAAEHPDFGDWFAVATAPETEEPVLLVARWLCHLLGIRHRTAQLFLDHPTLEDHTYVQVRGVNKAESPAHFDLPAAGHVAGVGTPLDALWKELEEELGLKPDDVADLEHVASYEYRGLHEESGMRNVEWRTVLVARLKAEKALSMEFKDGEVAGMAVFALPALRDLVAAFPGRIASGLAASLPLYLQHRAEKQSGGTGV